MMRDCTVLAIEGTHASGKTTLTHALAAYYREQGIHVTTVEEPARHSPFIEEIVVHGKGQFDLETEADLFAAQLSAQLRAARQHSMIIADKTIANVLAYARIVLPAPAGSRQAAVLTAMEVFCRAWAPSTTWSSTAATPTPSSRPETPTAPKSWTCNPPSTESSGRPAPPRASTSSTSRPA